MAFKAAGLEHRRIYNMRHTFAAWHLVRDADDDQGRDLLDGLRRASGP